MAQFLPKPESDLEADAMHNLKLSNRRYVSWGILFLLWILLIFSAKWLWSPSAQEPKVDLLAVRPIPMSSNLWLEEMTWMEVRDRIVSGYDTVIVPTGGVEQNGPFVVTGKHNYIVSAISERVALQLGNTLVSPVVKFVPEGNHEPATGHLQYPGTIGVSETTFENLIYDICLSLELHGFRRLILLGDSGGNQTGLRAVSEKFNSRGKKGSATAIHIEEYYSQDIWSYDFLKSEGILQQPDVRSAQRGSVHSDYHYEAILAAVDPQLIRAEERINSGNFSINGIELEPLSRTIKVGRKLIDYRVNIVVNFLNGAFP